MNHGGIFNGPNALGILAGVDEAPVGAASNAIPCTGTSFVAAIQAELVRRGYTKLRTDGQWDECTASAWLAETGLPLANIAQVKSFLGVDCSTGFEQFTGTLMLGPWNTMPPTCSSGADKKTSGQGAGPGCASGTVWNALFGMCVPSVVAPPPSPNQPQPTTADPLKCPNDCAAKYTFGTPAHLQCVATDCLGLPFTPPKPVDPNKVYYACPDGLVVDSPAKCQTATAKASIFASPAYWAVVGAVVIGGALVWKSSQKKTVKPNPRKLRK